MPRKNRLKLDENKGDSVMGDSVFGDKIVISQGGVYAPNSEKQESYFPKDQLNDVVKDYLKELLSETEAIDLRGLPQIRIVSLPITDIYIPLRVTPNLLLKTEKDLSNQSSEGAMGLDIDNIDLTSFVIKNKHSVILGDPGIGKTTSLKFLARRLAQKFNFAEDKYLPVAFPIRVYSEYLQRNNSSSLIESIKAYLKHEKGFNDVLLYAFDQYLNEQKIHFLFDGLDEVIDDDHRRTVISSIENLSARFPGCFITTTSRIAGYDLAPLRRGFIEATVLPLDNEQIKVFVEKWMIIYQESVQQSGIRINAHLEANSLTKQIVANDKIRALASNVLLLTLIASIYDKNRGLPQSRIEIYKKCIEALSETWNKWRSLSNRSITYDIGDLELSDGFITRTLGPIALWNHGVQPGGLMEKGDLIRQLEGVLKDDGISTARIGQLIDVYLRIVQDGSGIISEKGRGKYSFLHLTFEEFLAGKTISELLSESDAIKWVSEHRNDSKWREVIVLAIGNATTNLTTSFVRDGLLITENTKSEPNDIILASEALIGKWKSSTPNHIWQMIQRKLLDLCQNLEVTEQLRRQSGGLLGHMGWTPDDLGEFAVVNKLRFLYGEEGIYTETEEFRIGLYPITNLQYAEFINAGGYDNSEFWESDGWNWRIGKLANTIDDAWDYFLELRDLEKRSAPWLWGVPEFSNPLFPVVGINYYEASAYCKWLNSVRKNTNLLPDGFEIRLPTEIEWEHAARGEDGRQYPWGESFDLKFSNAAKQLGKGHGVTIVASYPHGRSPYGLWDCAGNVWEWTISCQASDRRYIIRGGSWSKYYWQAKCFYKSSECPPGYGNNIGFRIVIAKENDNVL